MPRVRSHLIQAAGLLLGTALASAAVMQASSAAFNATTVNGTNEFGSATVTLSDNDADGVMFNLNNMVPGDTETRCITVTYTGTTFNLQPVKLYSEEGTTFDLAPYLDVKVEEGTIPATTAFPECTDFASEIVREAGKTLTLFNADYTNYATGLEGFTPTTGSTTKTYKFDITLSADTPPASEGDSAQVTFTWEIVSGTT